MPLGYPWVPLGATGSCDPTPLSTQQTMGTRGPCGWAAGGGIGLLLLVALVGTVRSQVLTPPYFNLAENRRITATATCGVDVGEDPELYCKLVGANSDVGVQTSNIIQGGQVSGGRMAKIHNNSEIFLSKNSKNPTGN